MQHIVLQSVRVGNARCEGQDQHQHKSVRDAATTFNYNQHHHRPGPTQHDAAITATYVRVCNRFVYPYASCSMQCEFSYAVGTCVCVLCVCVCVCVCVFVCACVCVCLCILVIHTPLGRVKTYVIFLFGASTLTSV